LKVISGREDGEASGLSEDGEEVILESIFSTRDELI
jgi:hypothetical protein